MQSSFCRLPVDIIFMSNCCQTRKFSSKSRKMFVECLPWRCVALRDPTGAASPLSLLEASSLIGIFLDSYIDAASSVPVDTSPDHSMSNGSMCVCMHIV